MFAPARHASARHARAALPLVLAMLALAALPAAAGAARAPKVTTYPVTVDAAGWVDYEWTWDDTEPCTLGEAVSVSEELRFELGRPRRATVQVIDGVVAMTFATGGPATHAASLRGYRTTNSCPPARKQPEPPRPVCRTLRGTTAISLSPQPLLGDLAPLGRGVMLNVLRRGGGGQDLTCFRRRPLLETVGSGVLVDTLALPGAGLSLPLRATDETFWRLRRGGRVARSIAIGGGCATVRARASALDPAIRRCTIDGRVVVTIKRVG